MPADLEQKFREIAIIAGRVDLSIDSTRSRYESLEAVREHLRGAIPTDDANWEALDDGVKKRLKFELSQVVESYLRLAELDGPSEAGHLMSPEYASTSQICWLSGITAGVMLLLLAVIMWNWNAATKTGGRKETQDLVTAAAAFNEAIEAVALHESEAKTARESRDEAEAKQKKAMADSEQAGDDEDRKAKLRAAAADTDVKKKQEALNVAVKSGADAKKPSTKPGLKF